MAYHKYKWGLAIRLVLVLVVLILITMSIRTANYLLLLFLIALAFFLTHQLWTYINRRFVAIDSFFESVKYKDFTRWFSENSGNEDLDQLHGGFNQVSKTLQSIAREKETQFLIRQKILELIRAGIIAYNIETGDVFWINNSFMEMLHIPNIKNIHFIKSRNNTLFDQVFEIDHHDADVVTLEIKHKREKVLISSSIFKIEDMSLKLVVVQDIEDALSINESTSWKKLLSVMTHEIMNSVAPIASLAETLQIRIKNYIEDSVKYPLEINDIDAGIGSIKNRSEGLYKFAQIYRSLNIATELKLEEVLLDELFNSINNLMSSTLLERGIQFRLRIQSGHIKVQMDRYLIEQVLINLILNSADACQGMNKAEIVLSTHGDLGRNVSITVADNGMGISDDIIDDIFIPFFSTKANGSGIGLSLSKQIILLHKGRIQVQSSIAKGTGVTLVLPYGKSL